MGGQNVTGYIVTLMKDDGTNNFVSGLMSNWTVNWMGLGKMMEQTSQLRVYTDRNKTVKYFEISQLLSYQQFKIEQITSYNEEQNRVRLTTGKTDQQMADIRNSGNWHMGSGTAHRYLYFDSN